jgi:hypothetical protein
MLKELSCDLIRGRAGDFASSTGRTGLQLRSGLLRHPPGWAGTETRDFNQVLFQVGRSFRPLSAQSAPSARRQSKLS